MVVTTETGSPNTVKTLLCSTDYIYILLIFTYLLHGAESFLRS